MAAVEQYVQLKDHEKIILIVRRYLLTYVLWYVVIFALLITPFFFLFPLMRWGFFGKLIFFGSLFLAVYHWLRLTYLWQRDCLIISTHRIIDVHQEGFTKRTISEAAYDRVSDVSHIVKGLTRVLFNYGTLRITCGDGSVILTFDKVKNPKEVHHVISEMMTRYAAGNLPAVEPHLVREDVRRMSEKELEEVAANVLARLEEVQAHRGERRLKKKDDHEIAT